MQIREIRQLTDDQLLDELEDRKRALFTMRFQKASGQLEDTSLLRQNRRIVARLNTVLRERQLAAEIAAQEENDG